jgi:hypothetical protein
MMLSVLLWLLLFTSIVCIIWLLHRNQRRRSREIAELNTPLPGIDNPGLPDFGSGTDATAPLSSDNWLANTRALRENGQFDAALALCRSHYPRAQAFQQVAIILRQQIREAVEQLQPANHLLRDLYRTAALADLFRTSNLHKPTDPHTALEQVQHSDFSYQALGHLHLKLLNKSDAKALEQLWGSPASHRHTEELLGESWLALCSPGGGKSPE